MTAALSPVTQMIGRFEIRCELGRGAQSIDKIPDGYRQRVPAKTFVLLPLNIKSMPVVMIYCDMDRPGSVRMSERELQLLKTLRNQAVLAIKQGTSGQ